MIKIMLKTYSLKQSEVIKEWLLIDAKGLVLGRLASFIARILRGKHKPTFTPHIDCGDKVIIINAKYVFLSGNKSDINTGKVYYHHTGFPGGIKKITAGKILASSHSERVMRLAISRMLSSNKLKAKQLSNLYIYSDNAHPHEAQKPKLLDFGSLNSKNSIKL